MENGSKFSSTPETPPATMMNKHRPTPETPGTPETSFRSTRRDHFGAIQNRQDNPPNQADSKRRKLNHERTEKPRIRRNTKINRNRPRNPGGLIASNLSSSADPGEARPTSKKHDHEYTGQHRVRSRTKTARDHLHS